MVSPVRSSLILLLIVIVIKGIQGAENNSNSSVCPYDYNVIEVVAGDGGNTQIDIELLPIQLLRQSESNVKFSIDNVWPTTSLDYVFTTYVTERFGSLHCVLNKDIPSVEILVGSTSSSSSSSSSTIQAYCNAERRTSVVRLYVRDSTFVATKENTKNNTVINIPRCCHDPLVEYNKDLVVREYIVIIKCSPTCPEDEREDVDNGTNNDDDQFTESPSESVAGKIIKQALPSPDEGPIILLFNEGEILDLDTTTGHDSLSMIYEMDVDTVTKEIGGNLKPIGRTYNGHPWEVYGTKNIEFSGVSFVCDDGDTSCFVTLPKVKDGRAYVLKSDNYPRELSSDDRKARFLEKTTFGPTKSEIAAFSSSPEEWVRNQMRTINITSHRQFYRERVTHWHPETNRASLLSAHPCKESARYRRYAILSEDDKRDIDIAVSPYNSSKLILSIDGHVRTVVDAPFQYGGEKSITGNVTSLGSFQICRYPFEGVGGRLLLKGNGIECEHTYFNGVYGNPAVNFDPLHLSLLEQPVVSLEEESYKEVMTSFFFQGKTEMLQLNSELGASSCNISNTFVPGFLHESIIIGQTNNTANGTQYWIHSTTFDLQNNNIDNPLQDGGKLAIAKTEDAPENEKRFRSLCSSAPRTFLNEDSCRLSEDACYVSEGEDVDIELSLNNLKLIYDATGGKDDPNTLYVYAMTALRNDPNWVDPPCTPGVRSRWIVTTDNCEDIHESSWDEKTEDTFRVLLTSSDDENQYMKDIFFPAGGSLSCSANDTKKFNFRINVDGTCYENTHPDNLQVFDMTYWTTDAHPGNFRENKIKAFADLYETWYLTFPDWHDIDRWHWKKEYFPNVGRLGDKTTLKSLPSTLLREDVAQAFGSARAIVSNGKVPVCGSPFEVDNVKDEKSGPLHKGGFDMKTLYNATSGGSYYRFQKLSIWAAIALSSRDQLRQRAAFALSQIFSVSLDSGADRDSSENHLSYYDIFVRNAFGNYFDIMKEVTYHPIMSYMLTYRNGQSTAYSLVKKGLLQTPDENYAREIMQLFSIGNKILNNNGTVLVDDNGSISLPYTNEDIAEYAKVYVGFQLQQHRGNIDGNSNQVDPLVIKADLKDHLPKLGLSRQYIGDGYPLCSDLPSQNFLKAGAVYRLLGSDPNPQLLNDPISWYGLSAKRVSLNFTSSPLALALCNGNGTHCDPKAKVVLTADLKCTGIECDIVGIPRTLQVAESLWFEYVRPPCVNQAFYNNAKSMAKRDDCGWKRFMCGNPKNQDASTLCCDNSNSKDLPWRKELFGGERVTFSTSSERCSANEGLRLCKDARTASQDCFYDPPDSDGYRSFNNGGCDRCTQFYWLSEPCSVRIKIATDGSIAVVHEHSIDTKTHVDTYRTVRNDTKMFFRADWKDSNIGNFLSDYFKNCVSLGCFINDVDRVCQCPTYVNESMAFYDDSELLSVHNLLETATIGAVPLSTQTHFSLTGVDGIKKYPSGVLSKNTIFEVIDFNKRVHYRKNIVSIVELGNGDLSFRNPVSFWSISEFTVRDARYELDAALEHYFYHQNTAPFVAYRLAQRFGVSNPLPRYVDVIATAFRTGYYSHGSQLFGSNRYGCMEATIAAVVLDRESNDYILDKDPASGQLQEPYLKLIRLYRSLEFVPAADNPLPRFQTSIQDLIGQEPYKIPNVFSYFKPHYSPPGLVSIAGLVSPESQVFNGPSGVNGANLFISFLKYGAANCYSGIGTSGVNAGGSKNLCEIGNNEFNFGNTKYLPASYGLNETSADEVVNDLATLLTSGRLGTENREICKDAYLKTLESGKSKFEAMINAQQLISLSPEFHSTNLIEKTGNNRHLPSLPNATSIPYKAVIFFMLRGGVDSWNVLVPESCSGTNSEGESVHDQYLRMRDMLAFDRSKGEFDLKIDPKTDQPCESFAINNELTYIKQLYDDGDALFLANTGVVNANGMNIMNYNAKTRTRLFDHAAMQEETKKIDPFNQYTGSGVLGRAKDILTLRGHVVNSMSINQGSISIAGTPGLSAPPTIVSQSGAKTFAKRPAVENYFEIEEYVKKINSEFDPFSSVYGEVFSSQFLRGIEEGNSMTEQLSGVSTDPAIWGERDGSLYDRMNTIAKLIKTRDDRHSDRDVFYTDYGSFDHHSDMKKNLGDRLKEVNDSLSKLVEELKKNNLWDNVTIVVPSEFARTITPNNGAGSDHGWGGNYFILGGQLRGGRILGKYPDDITVSSPLNAGANTRIRFIPTTSWDSVWHGIIQWFGVENEDDLDYCLPNKDNTASPVEDVGESPLLNKFDLYEYENITLATVTDSSFAIDRSLHGTHVQVADHD